MLLAGMANGVKPGLQTRFINSIIEAHDPAFI